jgi:DNA-binding MarR family transcriptional regulator
MTRKQIIEGLMENFQAIKRRLMESNSSIKKLGLTMGQCMVLRFIERNSPVNVKDVSKEFGITSSAATQMIDGLASRGLLIRRSNTKDRRETDVVLSDKAKGKLATFQEGFLKKMESVFDALNNSELEIYLKLNQKITEFSRKGKLKK